MLFNACPDIRDFWIVARAEIIRSLSILFLYLFIWLSVLLLLTLAALIKLESILSEEYPHLSKYLL